MVSRLQLGLSASSGFLEGVLHRISDQFASRQSLKDSSSIQQVIVKMSTSFEFEKVAPMQIEDAMNNDEKANQGDYSGATGKTDKAEIALVRKLDTRIMPALFCMYFLYVHRTDIISQT